MSDKIKLLLVLHKDGEDVSETWVRTVLPTSIVCKNPNKGPVNAGNLQADDCILWPLNSKHQFPMRVAEVRENPQSLWTDLEVKTVLGIVEAESEVEVDLP